MENGGMLAAFLCRSFPVSIVIAALLSALIDKKTPGSTTPIDGSLWFRVDTGAKRKKEKADVFGRQMLAADIV